MAVVVCNHVGSLRLHEYVISSVIDGSPKRRAALQSERAANAPGPQPQAGESCSSESDLKYLSVLSNMRQTRWQIANNVIRASTESLPAVSKIA